MSARDHDPRSGLRETDSHASWREVYRQLGVSTTQHEEVGDVGE